MIANKRELIIDLFLLAISTTCCLLLTQREEANILIAVLIILIGFWMCFKSRRNTYLSFLMVCLFLINTSIAINDIINHGVLTSSWQINGLRATEYPFIAAKCILLFISTLSTFINGGVVDECKMSRESINRFRWSNGFISMVGLIVLNAILLYGTFSIGQTFSAGSYTEISSTVYEYSVVLFVMVFLFSNTHKYIEIALLGYSVLFVSIFCIFGDRSSAFMYILAVLCLYFPQKLTVVKSLCFGLGGIVFSNIISAFRSLGSDLSVTNVLLAIVQKGLYQDTVSWAFYGGLTVMALRVYANQPIKFFYGFVLSVLGFSSKYSDPVSYARDNFSALYNAGGGIFPLFWYSWFGMVGVVLGASILGIILHVFFSPCSQTKYKFNISCMIILFSLRWYIYSPLNLFRSAIFLPSVLYGLFCLTAKRTF